MNTVRVLIPSVGHPTMPSLLRVLRDNGERRVEVVGVDMDPDGTGPCIADAFYEVPPSSGRDYMDRILEICDAARIDVYYALGEEDAIGASERIGEFAAAGVRVIRPGTPEMLRIATNKARYHQFFQSCGVPCAKFRVVSAYDQLESAVRELGYPDEDVFLKPAFSRGGRGAQVLSARELGGATLDAREGDVPERSLEALLDALAPLETGRFPELLAMEFLPGTYYSVDVLSWEGQPYYVIPKTRIRGTASNTIVGEVNLDADVTALAAQVCEAFGFSYLQNYEIRLDKNGEPRVYDINPRGGASLVLCAEAGANIAYYAVKLALGEKVPHVSVRDKVRMLRYYQEVFQHPEGVTKGTGASAIGE
jgi:carbamoyl-phosphate synthase large subunit